MAKKYLYETATGKIANKIALEEGADWSPPDGFATADITGDSTDQGEIGDIYNWSDKSITRGPSVVTRRDELASKVKDQSASQAELMEYVSLIGKD